MALPPRPKAPPSNPAPSARMGEPHSHGLIERIRRRLRVTPTMKNAELSRVLREAGHLPAGAQGRWMLLHALGYLAGREEISIERGQITAVEIMDSRRSFRAGFRLTGCIRRILRERPEIDRAALRAELREKYRISHGALGGRRLRDTLQSMAKAGEIVLTPDTVKAIDLLSPRPVESFPRLMPETPGKLRRKLAEKRARAVAARRAKCTAGAGA